MKDYAESDFLLAEPHLMLVSHFPGSPGVNINDLHKRFWGGQNISVECPEDGH